MKYPNIIFYRLIEYNQIDDLINNNKDKFNCNINITCDLMDLNNIFDTNYHLIITYGDKNKYLDIINDFIPKRYIKYWLHYNTIENIELFNYNVNYKYVNLCIENRELTRPVFSIFTTCYNSNNIINRPLNSLLNQTLLDWEWIVIDDSPDDEHFKFLKKTLIDKRIRLYKRDKNSGNIGNVKNEAISLCRGKYVLELDHDDEITSNLLEDSIKIFNLDPEIGFIYSDFINIYDDNTNFFYSDFISLGYGGYYTQKINNKWRNIYITPNINNITMSYLVSMPNHPRIWRRNLLNQLDNYSENLPICDDFEILLRTCINCKIVKLCDTTYTQYMNNNNNNFSLIRNAEINRIGPNFISPIFYDKYDVHNKMKELNGYENKDYIKNHSQIWKRKLYQHKFINQRINLNYDKIYCIIGHKNIYKIKEYYDNKRNDFIVLDNCMNLANLQKILDNNNLNRVKCYILQDSNEYELIKYFHLMYKYTDNYEIIINNFVSRDTLINSMINLNNYNNYLEIGVENGYTFKNIELKNKIGVDPTPQYNNENIIVDTSDNFFKNNTNNFDCIFIDGMHQSDYVLRDLNNSIKFLNENGTIIIDDILPLNKEEQNDKPLDYYYKDNILKSKSNWTGDVWKVIYELLLNYEEYIKNFSYYENNNYRGIFSFKLKDKFSITNINNYSYDKDFENYNNLIKNKIAILPNYEDNFNFNDILIFDNFIYEKILNDSINNIKSYDNLFWKNEYIEDKQINKYYINDINIIDDTTIKIFNYFSSDIFIEWLCKITKIDNLLWDNELFGGGIHKTTKNGKLNIHSDFNTLRNSKKYRRINILLYLNKDWQKNYNGELELWNEEMNQCYKSIEPIFNRMVILNTYTNHGHPQAWNNDDDRLSFAFYYYTKEKPKNIKHETFQVQWKNILNNNLIHPIKYENKKIIIIDNFYNDIDDVRTMALKQEFNIKGNYPGIRTKSFANDNIKKMFEQYIGKKIIYWPDEYNGSFQYTTKEMDSWVHRDVTTWAGIIYLTPNAPLAAGTAFFKHKKTKIENLEEYNNSTKEIQKELDNDGQNMNKWEMIDYVGNKYNRLVLFQGSINHRSMEYFGDNKENGRLFQTWFFNTE